MRLTKYGYVIEVSLPESVAINNNEIGIVIANTTPGSNVISYIPPVSSLNEFYLPEMLSNQLQELLIEENILGNSDYLVLDKDLRIRASSTTHRKIRQQDLKPYNNPWHIRQVKKIVFLIQKIFFGLTREAHELDYQQAISVLAEQALTPPVSGASLLAILPNNNRVILVAQPLVDVVDDQNIFGLVVASTNLTRQMSSLINLPDLIFLISGLTLLSVFFSGSVDYYFNGQ